MKLIKSLHFLAMLSLAEPVLAESIKYEQEFPRAPEITDDLCRSGASSANTIQFNEWVEKISNSGGGVCTSAKAAYVLNAKFAQVISYCLSKTTNPERRSQGQQELASAQSTMSQAESTAKGSCP
ncbi:hypothetical protein [Herbaspirillum seropedicae]|uniref:hypothetical protein n=1 Tax=Herbaspirillum seropedicae TaxID=964 RepID=UPI003D97D64F